MWEFAPSCGLVEEVCGIGGGASLGVEPAGEDLDGGEVAGDGGGFEVSVSLEGGEVCGEGVGGDVGGGGDVGFGEVCEEVAEVSAVGVDGCGGQAALDADVCEEVVAGASELCGDVDHGLSEYRRVVGSCRSMRMSGLGAHVLRGRGGKVGVWGGHAV